MRSLMSDTKGPFEAILHVISVELVTSVTHADVGPTGRTKKTRTLSARDTHAALVLFAHSVPRNPLGGPPEHGTARKLARAW